jgi:myosin V
LYNLKLRHVREKPYTRTGDIVIAVNPYQWYHELYTEEKRYYYANRLLWEQSEEDARATMEPHVYEVSALSYKGLAMGEQEDQSILVSGESGAGKTETVKICLNHIASVQRGQVPPGYYGDSEYDPIVQRIVQSNPLLEAFGNAKTRRNDNSSRFGKYLQLQFQKNVSPNVAALKPAPLGLVGSRCDVYLLEKNRVITHESEERNFHIFYQLLAANDHQKVQFWEGLRGTRNESFKYVGSTKTNTIEGKSDAARFDETLKALELVDVSGEKLNTLMRAICITLQLGNMGFKPYASDSDKSVVATFSELTALSELMGVAENTLKLSFTERTFTTAKETHKVPLNATSAQEACDALAKEIYQKAFLWLVDAINKATSADDSREYGTIGLLDIFGFESFAVNRFEQLCINYANEKLQQKFTEDVFANVQAEYKAEGISLDDIWYDDNTDVLDLIEGRTGLLNLLNEECVRPKGNDFDFVQKSLQINKSSPALIIHRTDRLSFGIQHYAGQVMYDGEFFVIKNLDTLPTDLQECAEQCTNAIISAPRSEPSGKSSRNNNAQSNINAPTVWSKYKTQLSTLMANLRRTKSRYIRCIKPNSQKMPSLMEHAPTVEQLRCAGVVAGITIARSCFPNRLPNSLVLARYSNLMDPKNFPSRKNSGMTIEQKRAEDCKALMNAALVSKTTAGENGAPINAFTVGKTKTYFRAGALEFLESNRVRGLDSQATTIQRAARGWLARNKGRYSNQRHKMEEAMRLAAERAEEERLAQIARANEERVAERQRAMQKLMAECEAMEREMLREEKLTEARLKASVEKAAKRKKELADLEEQFKAEEAQEIHGRAAEKALQDKRLEEATKLIHYLKRENLKARKELEKYRAKRDGELSTNGILEDSVRDFSANCNFAEELAILERNNNDSMMNDYESSKALNRELKHKFRTQQNLYLEIASSRLDLQKCLKKIMIIIDESKGKPNNAAVRELNRVVSDVENMAKSEMAALEAQFSNYRPGDYTETEYEPASD